MARRTTGLVYAILGLGFIPVAIFRYHMAVSNAHPLVALEHMGPQHHSSPTQHGPQTSPSTQQPDQTLPTTQGGSASHDSGPSSHAQEATPVPVHTVLRESFVTAGSVVAAATAFVGSVEIALLVLILRI